MAHYFLVIMSHMSQASQKRKIYEADERNAAKGF
nr:MAG TPA: hypothetical protein [Caudoviricetes sp.]